MISPISAQIDSVIAQLSGQTGESFAGGISGDGRFVVFESKGNIATENPRNADGNIEIFLFDYAQRRIFQITDTKSVLFNPTLAATYDNVRVLIENTRPVISNDGKWIAFSSNATTSRPSAPDNTNPGSFDGNTFTAPTPTPTPTPSPSPTPTASPTPTPTPAANPLANDGNLEIWLYRIPTVTPVADLSAGDEIPFTDLAGGTFIRVTNTDASQLPVTGSASNLPAIADDNHDPSISDDGHAIAFVSTRDLVPSVGNAPPSDDNDEIFTYFRDPSTLGNPDGGLGTLNQVTKTSRGLLTNPIYNKNPTISGAGLRVAFTSTGDDPIDNPNSATNFDTGSNPSTSRNEEIFYADLSAGGVPTGGKQVTTTTPTNAGDPVNIFDLGRRMSRDGRYIAFDSYADLANENGGTNYTSFATYLYDTTTSTFRRILARSDADSAASGGDLNRYPTFTDNNGSGTPSTLVLETRMNIKADGTVAATATDGLNNITERPSQLYSYPITVPASSATFTRLASFPVPSSFLASTQLLASNTLKRSAFNLALSELGLGNLDAQSKVYYLLIPTPVNVSAISASFATGASREPISVTPTPSPSPTATPTPTPTPTPTASPTPTPTPVTPPSVYGIGSGMQVIMDFQAALDRPIAARTGVGSLSRVPSLPIEMSGVTLTINGAACGLRAVSRHKIDFVAPPALPISATGTSYPLVLINNGTIMRTSVIMVPAQPDIFNREGFIGPGGRTKVFNVTNRVHTSEPFSVKTRQIKPFGLVASKLRLYLTGVSPGMLSVISIRVGPTSVPILSEPVQVEPGVFTVDFSLVSDLNGKGDQPIIVTVTINGQTFQSRLDDTATKFYIL